MIFVSGTKRSGTSMWMQVLRAAGMPVLGEAFPRQWDQGPLRDANPDGFYESLLRQGIYFGTNPHPVTGTYFMPEDVQGYAVKVFVPGVIRSERAYITHLIANVRAWREYETSIERLFALEDQGRGEHEEDREQPVRLPAALEWWMENFALVRDISLRKLPFRMHTYEAVISKPESVVSGVLGWIGHGDVEKAVAAVKPEHRTQVDSGRSDSIEPALARVFDDLYAAVAAGKGFSRALLGTLNDTNQRLLPRLTKLQHEVAAYQMRLAARGKRRPEPIHGLPKLPR
ncbi:hypothetical protein DB30_02935 [Enhygromyxa salina]|uniref:Sulfotransferase domain-containing protein n=1 Tax=Enhygromyxa salina TaxID=215803 RepID=A0A0C2D7R9_9BACT|nr:hypothetical protein [Enhygromyxa salina]KIG17660.1 hypothetical protein DB30_02935 [Enhygromyxa salina]